MPLVTRLKSFIPSSVKTKESNCMGKPLPTAGGGGGSSGVIITELAKAIIEHFLPVTSQEEHAIHMWYPLGHSEVDH